MQIESERVAFSEILWILVGVGANCYGIPFWWCNITIQTDCYCCTSHHLSFMFEHSRLTFHISSLKPTTATTFTTATTAAATTIATSTTTTTTATTDAAQVTIYHSCWSIPD